MLRVTTHWTAHTEPRTQAAQAGSGRCRPGGGRSAAVAAPCRPAGCWLERLPRCLRFRLASLATGLIARRAIRRRRATDRQRPAQLLLGGSHGLREVVEDVGPVDGGDGGVGVRVDGEADPARLRGELAGPLQQLDPVAPGIRWSARSTARRSSHSSSSRRASIAGGPTPPAGSGTPRRSAGGNRERETVDLRIVLHREPAGTRGRCRSSRRIPNPPPDPRVRG
jgi:hypothetical protein